MEWGVRRCLSNCRPQEEINEETGPGREGKDNYFRPSRAKPRKEPAFSEGSEKGWDANPFDRPDLILPSFLLYSVISENLLLLQDHSQHKVSGRLLSRGAVHSCSPAEMP